MASDGASPLPGPDVTMKPGAALSPFTALPFPPPTPGPPDQPLWEPSPQPSLTSAFSPGNPLVLSAFPSPLLVTGEASCGPSGAGTATGKVIVKVKAEGGPAEPSQTQNFILTQTALSWISSGAPCGSSEGPPAQYITASNMKPILPTEAVGVSQEGPPGLPQAPPPAAQLAPIVPPEKAWPGPQGALGEAGSASTQKPSLGDLAYTSKGVYENFRRWQCYKALARRHESQSPDVEALSCFLIPVLRSLARRKPTMTLEEGLPRAVQEWEHTSNFDRMIFYEMAEKFMEFEAEEELQIQNAQLMNGAQGLPPAAPLKSDPPGPPVPEVCQQPVYIPKKAASKARAPRRRQRKPQRPPVPEAPKEIPPEAVREYIDIMEGLEGNHLATGESDGKQEEQQEEEAMYPDPSLLSYIDELCSQEIFVSKVEAIIHPQFMADLLSPEQERDPLALMEELEQEEGLTLAQLVQKRLLALEQEDVETPPNYSAAQLVSSHSVSDKDEGGGGRPRTSSGPQRGTVCLGKAVSSGKQAREMHGGQQRALDGLRGMRREGNTLPSSSWDLQVELGASQGTQALLGMERKGSRKVINQLSPHQEGHLGGARSPGHCLAADRTSEALPLCWQEGPQPKKAPSLDVELEKPAPPQGQGLEKQGLGLQTVQQMGELEVLPQGKEPSAALREGSSGTMCRDDRGPPMVQNCDQKPSPGAAGDRDRTSLSPGLWLSSEMDAVGLELPLQIEEVIESYKDGECITEHQELGSGNSISLDSGETTVPRDVGSSVVPCGETDATAALEKRNYCSLSVPLRANSPVLGPNREQIPETIQDSDLWAEGCSPLLESRVGTSTLGSSKETLMPACQGNPVILGTQDASSFPEGSQEAGSRGNLFSPLLETTEHKNILNVRDNCNLQLGVSKDTCPINFTSDDPQGVGREDKGLSKLNDLVPLQSNQDTLTLRASQSTSPHQGLQSSSPIWGTRDALVLRETSPMSKTHTSDVIKGGEKEEGEDEGLSNFAYLLASKLSLSPRGPPLSPCQASGSRSIQRASYPSTEERGLSQAPYPVKSGKRAIVGGPAAAEKRPQSGTQLGVPGEKPLALGAVRPSQPRKRRRDSFVTGRRKKRRRSQ
ncbi:NUT family member 1 [Marmota flaviventris]|uniref:NUT family member 1 n=1 Tax=Marmota flaviventris TaxID=93162 RepID=UPI003A871D9D